MGHVNTRACMEEYEGPRSIRKRYSGEPQHETSCPARKEHCNDIAASGPHAGTADERQRSKKVRG
jgi:hypothetical protein